MARYWVIGGEYTDTGFTDIAGGGAEERHGPFGDIESARARWQQLAWTTVDNAHMRYRIEQDRDDMASARYWVVGSRYTDTTFATPADGEEQWHGPFDCHEAAKEAWSRLAWQSVDDALTRWRIERLVGGPPAGRGTASGQ